MSNWMVFRLMNYYDNPFASAIIDGLSALANAEKYEQIGQVLYDAKNYDAAIEAYTNAITLNGSSHQLYFKRALAYFRKDDWLSVVKDVSSSLTLNPYDARCYQCLGAALNNCGEYDAAIEAYSSAIALDGTQASFYTDRAQAYSSKGNNSSTIKDARSALQINPRHAEGYYWLGVASFLLKNYDDTIEACTVAIELDSTNSDYYAERARAYLRKGDNLSAIKDAKSSITINPDNAMVYGHLGAALQNEGKYDEAIEAYTNAIALDGTKVHYYTERAIGYSDKGDYLSAIEDTRSALEIDPQSAESYYLLGRALYQAEKYDEVIEPLTTAIELDGTNAGHYSDRALAYLRNGDNSSAAKDAQSALAIDPNDSLAYGHLGVALIRLGKCDEGIEAYTNAIAHGGNAKLQYTNRAEAYLEKGNHVAAIKDAKAAIAIDPEYPRAHHQLGRALHETNKHDEAIEALTNAIALEDDPSYYCDRAHTYLLKGDNFSAIKDARSALAIDPDHANGHRCLGEAFENQEKYDEAIEAYTKAITLDSTKPSYYVNRAQLYLIKGNYVSAVKDARSALTIDPNYADGYNQLGRVSFVKKEYDEAVEAFSKAISLGSSAVYLSNRALAYLCKGDHLSAIKDAESALEIDPTYAEGYARLGRALYDAKKCDKAIEALTKAIALDGTGPFAYVNRALAYLYKGNHLPAIKDAEAALQISPKYAEAYGCLGRGLFHEKKYDEAIKAYTNAITIDGTNPDYYTNRAEVYIHEGNHSRAIEDAELALGINPEYVKGYYWLGNAYYSSGQVEIAVNVIELGLQFSPADADLKSLLATLEVKSNPGLDTPPQQEQSQQLDTGSQKPGTNIKTSEGIENQNSFTVSQDFQRLENHLLRGLMTVKPRAIECIPGTRTDILADIVAKADDRDGANILWIRGAPGSGKSSISLSAKSRLRDQGQLVSYFRFDRNEATIATSVALWRQAAYDLARLLPSVRTQLLQELRDDKVDLNSSIAVFTSLIEKPLSNITDSRSLVIVIDAIDECGGLTGPSSLDRRALLRTLGRWNQLPKCFKLLITSREESDINQVLAPISMPVHIPSGHHVTESPQASASIHAANDLRLFLEERFRQVRERFPSLPTSWPGTVTVNAMVRRAAGNFLWATTAADFIDCRGIDPHDRLGRVMGHAPESSSMRPLYSLYTAVLETAFGDIPDDGLEAATLRSILGTMVLARRPLRDIEYVKVLTTASVTEAMLDSIRTGLSSAIAPGPALRFTHKSFDDFLLSEECSEKYRISIEESHHFLAKFCLATMAEGLHLNMCGLETSCLKNADIPDFESKVGNGIPALLSYSCCFWADHLSLIPFDELLLEEVKSLVLDKLLYWLEAMSLLKEINRVSHSLLSLLKWSHPSPDDEFKDFLHDARRFVGAFGQPIVQSAPHIYISALAFAPEYSSVARHFLPQFPRILSLEKGKPADWPSCVFTTEYHKEKVSAIAFSPDGKYFVSGSANGIICVCDSDTGNLISGPFGPGGGSSSVYSVCFDPDTRRVWAAMGQMVGWDVETGDKYLAIDAEFTTSCCCVNGSRNIVSISRRDGTVTFWNTDTGTRLRNLSIGDGAHMVAFSPDSCYMACAGEYDTTVVLWKLVDGNNLQGPSRSRRQLKHKSRISALSFSVESNFAVSGSVDGTILIWDARTGDTIGRPLDTGSEVNAIAYSSQRNVLVSAAGNPGTVMVWDASTHEAILGPLEGHTSWIRAISLSRDCRRALTGSWDGTVRMWDLSSRKGTTSTSNTNEGHMAIIQCVAFSPCGTKLASLDQWAIRVWDAKTGESLLNPISNESFFSRIIFSPDGSHMVAYYSDDGNIQVMNADSGGPSFLKDLNDVGLGRTRIEHLSFRSTDQRMITCSDHGVVRIWTLEGGTIIEDPLPSSLQRANASRRKRLAFSPDGLTAIVQDRDVGRHYVWSITPYHPLPITFADDENISGDRVTYAPSGRFFASVCYSSQDTLRVWNTQTGKLTTTPMTLGARIDCLVFSPDDRHIAFSCSSHSTSAIWIWDIHSGRRAPEPKKHNSNITALAFSPDGKTLVSASDDLQIRIWNTFDLLGYSKVSDGPLGADPRMEDGWIMDADEKLLFWVPKDHRARLVLPGNAATISGSGTMTEVDLSKFAYGERWTESYGMRFRD